MGCGPSNSHDPVKGVVLNKVKWSENNIPKLSTYSDLAPQEAIPAPSLRLHADPPTNMQTNTVRVRRVNKKSRPPKSRSPSKPSKLVRFQQEAGQDERQPVPYTMQGTTWGLS